MPGHLHRYPRHALKRLGLAMLTCAALFGSHAYAEPKDGGVLSLVAQPEPPSLMHGVVTHVSTQYVSGKVLQGLLTFDTDLKPQPVLAKRWTVSPDGLTYTFDLQPGVTWHDGEPLTEQDVACSLANWPAAPCW
ncbi:ABC transporter substrate-binding protein [Pseudomonas putida]|uniref:ABC transporter substrate-binding protein n=1 Tax=Pseudomonas putida TaxID=303 RepID=UPI001EE284C3|nr:ABC transporter substrate-binding protein [Pseudomonas putida]